MTCRYCGNEMRDDAKFCPRCGAVNGSGAEGPAYPGPYGYSGPEAPVGGGKKRKKGLLIGGAAAAVAVVALLVVVVSGLFTNPKGQVEKALSKTLAAYAQAEKAMGLSDLSGLAEKQSVTQALSVELAGLDTSLFGYDLSALEGLGMSMRTDLDVKSRNLGMELAAFWDGQDLIRLQLAADDAELYFASHQLTGGTFYGVNTETLGEDLERMGNQDAGEISFNLFDIIEPFLNADRTKELEQSVKEANKALWDAARAEKRGSSTLDINGTSTKTTAYRLTIPQEALEDYVDTMADLLSAMNYFDLYEQMFQAAGMPQDEIDRFLDELNEMNVYSELADSLKDALEELGDVRLEVFVSGGYVSAVQYEERIQGSTVKAALYLGGGVEYVDDLSLEMEVDGQKLTVDSTGDHGGKQGSITDKTTLRAGGLTAVSDFQYTPRDGSLSWDISIPGAGSLEMEGELKSGEDSMELHLDQMAVKVLGLELLTFKVDYQVGPCSGPQYDLDGAQLVTEMESLDLARAYVEIEANALTWVQDMQRLFTARLPEELLYGLTYGSYSMQ